MSRQIICKSCKSPAIRDGNKITCTGCGLETEGLSFAWIVKIVRNVEEQKIQEEPKMEEKKTEQETATMPNKKTKLCEVEGCMRKQWKGRMCYKHYQAKQKQDESPRRPERPAEDLGFPTYDEAMRKMRTLPVFHASAENVIILDFTGREDLLEKLTAFGEEELRSPTEQAMWFVREALQAFGE
ncbi:MAG: hypothetical protein A4E65_00343 [Syntrophorhabdus sp. PtaU1.Bin153]|nr:MAG: hypothetical protein A4E65_00343 [Syntrophorhabdus sp. PtaU1.Bin153]